MADDAIPVHFGRLAQWMDGEGLGTGPITDSALLTGGTQNVMVMFARAGRRYVLRRPPPNPRPESNEVMRREMKVLKALAGSDVPHPAFIAGCDDQEVLGATFYLMESVDGFNAIVGLPAMHASDPAIRRQMGFSYIDGAAALSKVDHVAVGLGDFGKIENWPGRQVERWKKQLAGYAAFDGWPGPQGLPGVAEVADWLGANVPASFQPGLLHGDYVISNVMFRNDGRQLAAIVDWELSQLGDPLIDMAWVVATWRGAGGPDLSVLMLDPFDGYPTAAEMVAHYAAKTGRDLTHFDWYVVLSCFKLGIILEGTYARACAGLALTETGDALHDTSVKLMQRAIYRIEHPGEFNV